MSEELTIEQRLREALLKDMEERKEVGRLEKRINEIEMEKVELKVLLEKHTKSFVVRTHADQLLYDIKNQMRKELGDVE